MAFHPNCIKGGGRAASFLQLGRGASFLAFFVLIVSFHCICVLLSLLHRWFSFFAIYCTVYLHVPCSALVFVQFVLFCLLVSVLLFFLFSLSLSVSGFVDQGQTRRPHTHTHTHVTCNGAFLWNSPLYRLIPHTCEICPTSSQSKPPGAKLISLQNQVWKRNGQSSKRLHAASFLGSIDRQTSATARQLGAD